MWRMYGYLRNGTLTDVGSRNYVVLQRLPHPIVEVEVTLADDTHPATHWGWVEGGRKMPSNIWPSEELYRTCFRETPEAQEQDGHGHTVRLSIRPRGRMATQ